MKQSMKFFQIIIYILGFIPLGFIISIFTFYFHVAIILKKLPVYNQPDPKELDIYSNYNPIIYLATKIWFYTIIFWFLAVIIYAIGEKREIKWKSIGLTGLVQLIGILIMFSEIFEWYVD